MLSMKTMPKHTGVYLVCFIFVSFCLMISPSVAAQHSNASDSLCNIKEFHYDFMHHIPSGPSTGQLILTDNCIYFPWASQPMPDNHKISTDFRPVFSNSRENVVMNASCTQEQVKDLVAFNANMQRDIVFEDSQSGDPMKSGLKNSMDISVSRDSMMHSKSSMWLDGEAADNGIEDSVDNAMSSSQHNDSVYSISRSGSQSQQRLGNYMNIDVSGIDVKAINTVQGGSAVATSNIVIKPVQIINAPSEVEEKLK
jgi:hypothetical protein